MGRLTRQLAMDPETISELCLWAGVTSVILAMTYRRLREEHLNRHKPSKRSEKLTKGGTPAHLVEHIKRLGDPEYVCLSIAENKLTVGPLIEKILELSSTTRNISGHSSRTTISSPAEVLEEGEGDIFDSPGKGTTFDSYGQTSDIDSPNDADRATVQAAKLATMGYGDQRGPQWVRRELAEMMSRCVFGGREVDPDKLVIAAGATSALRLIMLALTEQGQGCLIPSPYFPGFDKSLNAAGVRACMANGPETGGGLEGGVDSGISPRVLQAGLRAAREEDVEIRVLLITSPHNPTGRLYSAKALLGAVAWARKRGLHVIVDEVYANCVHRPHAPFRSMGSLLSESEMGGDVHILYGFSKDLGVAGWRLGVLYSENVEVVKTLCKMIHNSQASSDTMDTVGRLLLEPGFVDDFFRQHQEGLREAYMSLVNVLGRRGIMHLQAEAGLFAMLDLREFLEDSSMEAEGRLWRQILDRTGVNLTPGATFHCVEPGWFRLCFAYQKIDVVSQSVEKVADFLEGLVLERAAAAKGEQQQQKPPAVQAATDPSAKAAADDDGDGDDGIVQPPSPSSASSVQLQPQVVDSDGQQGDGEGGLKEEKEEKEATTAQVMAERKYDSPDRPQSVKVSGSGGVDSVGSAGGVSLDRTDAVSASTVLVARTAGVAEGVEEEGEGQKGDDNQVEHYFAKSDVEGGMKEGDLNVVETSTITSNNSGFGDEAFEGEEEGEGAPSRPVAVTDTVPW